MGAIIALVAIIAYAAIGIVFIDMMYDTFDVGNYRGCAWTGIAFILITVAVIKIIQFFV